MLDSSDRNYKIGAVARITGIGSETLRAWERRYSAVVPSRTESGDRIYSKEDVSKLLLLKSCVDSKFSIGTIANLDTQELNDIIESNIKQDESRDNVEKKTYGMTDVTSRVVLLGEGFPLRLLDGLEEIEGIELLGMYDNLHDLVSNNDNSETPNVVITESPTINKNTKKELQDILDKTGAWHVVLLYGYGSQENIEHVQSSQMSVARLSTDVQELARMAIYHTGGSERLPALKNGATLHFEQTIPSRIYSNKQLSILAGISSDIQCECPKHLSDLVRDLVSFEIYSAECENANDDDAAIHNYLHATAAQARSSLEEAIAHLVKVEGISLE